MLRGLRRRSKLQKPGSSKCSVTAPEWWDRLPIKTKRRLVDVVWEDHAFSKSNPEQICKKLVDRGVDVALVEQLYYLILNSKPETGDLSREFHPSLRKKFNWTQFLNYQLDTGDPLGEGTYGVVVKAMHKQSGVYVALKKIKMEGTKEGIAATTIREVSLLRACDHDHIVPLISPIFHNNVIYIVFPFYDWDLYKWYEKNGPLTVWHAQTLVRQLIAGVDYCHGRRVFHRDLKPQNLLLSGDGLRLYIADFGLGREHSLPIKELTHEVVTLYYRCPEIMLGAKEYGGGVDMWSIGCIFVEMFTTEPLFRACCEIYLLFYIFQFLGTPNEHSWANVTHLPHYSKAWPVWKKRDFSDLRDFLQNHELDPFIEDLANQCLEMDPSARISSKEVLTHPFLEAEIEKDISLGRKRRSA